MKKIDLTDLTFLIPVRIDCQERLENLRLTVQFLRDYFKTEIIVLEADSQEKVHLSEDILKIFREDHDPVFHRTKYLNQMTNMAKTLYLGIWDADVIGIPSQIDAGINLLRNGEANMVFPYNRYFYAVPDSLKKLYLDNNCRLDILMQSREYMSHMHGDWSVGGAFLVNRQAYVEAGMENEHFYGWGPEDAERYVRWDTLGYKIKRVDGPLFHMPHPRGITSLFASDNIEKRNRKEFLKICSMFSQDLMSYISGENWRASEIPLTAKDTCIIDFPKQPETTWVIRTLNEEKWLGKVLESLFLQSRLDFEIIIVDSGSTDKTLKIIDFYPIRKVINIESGSFNYSSALNQGIKEAWGKYIGIISGHSLPVSRTWYEDAMKNFEDQNVAAVSGHYHSLPDGSYEEKLFDLHFRVRDLAKQHYCKMMTNTNAIIRKDLWEFYPFDESLSRGCEDYDWASEMISRGYNVIKDPAFNVYHSHGGIGRRSILERFSEWNEICFTIDQKVRSNG